MRKVLQYDNHFEILPEELKIDKRLSQQELDNLLNTLQTEFKEATKGCPNTPINDVIVILSGPYGKSGTYNDSLETIERIKYGIKIAPPRSKIILAGTESHVVEMREMARDFAGKKNLALCTNGCPENAISVDQMLSIKKCLESLQNKPREINLVTSWYHGPRAARSAETHLSEYTINLKTVPQDKIKNPYSVTQEVQGILDYYFNYDDYRKHKSLYRVTTN